MLHLCKSVASKAVTFGLIGLLLVGLLIGAIRLALPFADLFRAELEGTLSESLGVDVRVGRLGLRLAGLAPQLTLENTEFLEPTSGRPLLGLEHLQVELSLAASLREMTPQVASVTLTGAHLVIKRLRDGTITLSGVKGLETGDPKAMTFFLGNGRFLLADSDLVWIDEQAGTPALHLSGTRIDFRNLGERHRINLLARLCDDPQTHLRLVGDLHGIPGIWEEWGGQVYLHWKGKNLGRTLAGWLPPGLQVASDAVEIESWNHLEGMLVTRSLSRIAALGLSIWNGSTDQHPAPLHFDRLGALLRWRRLDQGWRLEVKDLMLTRGAVQRPASDWAISYASGDDGGWSIAGGNRFLDLADARDLLARLRQILPKALDLVNDIHPGGELYDLRFRFQSRPRQSPEWALSGRGKDLSLGPWGQLPGLRGLTLDLAANEREGYLVAASDDLTLDLPGLLPHSLRLEEAAGEVRWRREAGGELLVKGREIVAGNADIATRSRFSLALPAGGGSPFLDLQTDFRDVRIASVRHYIPSKRLNEKLAGWLEGAFLAGSIPSGSLLFHGAVADFPFDQQQGRFEVLFAVTDCILDFHHDWPPLEALTGEVLFLNREMRVSVSQGRFLDSNLSDISARIPDLGKAVAVEVQGAAEGPFADDLRVLGETPLRKQLGAVARSFKADGVARLDLDMTIPLPHKGNKKSLRLAGELSWPGPATLRVPAIDSELRDLVGKLRFTERTLEAESIEAKLWGVPVQLRVATREIRGSSGASTRIRAGGRFPIPVLARQFPSPTWELMKGSPRLELALDITGASLGEHMPPIDFELTSELDGLALELPAPLGKPAAAARALRLSGRLAAEEPLRIQGGYGDVGIILESERSGDRLRLTRGAFNLGGDTVPLPKGEGFHLSGAVETLDLEPWLQWWEGRNSSALGDLGGRAALRSADLRIERALIGETVLNEVHLDLANRDNGWEATLQAREVAGKATIPPRPRREPLRIILDRLDLKGVLAHGGSREGTPTAIRRADPRQVHTLDLDIEQLSWGDNPLGRLTFRSQAVADGLELTDVVLAGPLISITGRGKWIGTDRGPRTNLSLTAKAPDLGEFLRSLEFNSLLHKAPADLDLELDWPGSPLQFSTKDLNGRGRFDAGAGSLLEVEPGVGRMLGILNLETLQRRLTLDFSDLFGRGFAFEQIRGQLEVEKGTAGIEELVIEGPSANISITGTTDLVHQKLDQVAIVTPRIGTSVAIASAVAGGPLVGAAVFLADRVSGGAVDSLVRYQYVLTGPWADPEIRRGSLGADPGREAAPEHLPRDSDRGDATKPHDSDPPREHPGTPSQMQGRDPRHKARSPHGSAKNPFLEGS